MSNSKEVNYLGSIFTSIGSAKMANSVLTGKAVEPVYIVVGDGGGQGYTPQPEQRSLVSEVYRMSISRMDTASDDKSHVILWGQIPYDVGSFVIREIGLLDKDGDLISVGAVPDISKIKPDSLGTAIDITIKYHLIVSEKANFTVEIDPTTTIASTEFVLEVEQRILESIPQDLEITYEMIDTLDDMEVGIITYIVDGEDITADEVRRLLDDDPDNDPEFENNPVLDGLELSRAEVNKILKGE